MTAPLPLDPAHTALVLVDLMDRIVALPLEPRKGTEVLTTAEELAVAFRSAGAPVVLVRGERPGAAEQPPGSGLVAGLLKDGDVEVVKRTIGAFQGTDLDARLRERGVTRLVFGGIATNLAWSPPPAPPATSATTSSSSRTRWPRSPPPSTTRRCGSTFPGWARS
ncbi:hypothetical protein GCM10010121_049740 [Streptomyces brasiliensis]|uniref:Isochorismatase-like domain-containing protein n=1 Tax=Streptomyces brasiliensis TaxID=1954 RepID=A0A917KZI2_9ACTN|nr:hypothetical protein GCM10010121_049740 [Streptomyces brasiliensis]